MNINDRLDNMSKVELISLIKEIKITCESSKHSWHKSKRNMEHVLKFMLRLIKGEL